MMCGDGCRGAMNCALVACIVFPCGRNELRPYIDYPIPLSICIIWLLRALCAKILCTPIKKQQIAHNYRSLYTSCG